MALGTTASSIDATACAVAPKGKLIGCWSTMEKGGAGYLISGRLVEAWVREAVERGESTAGMQVALDVDA
jgi:hypothetical protein